ncbi:MAG: M56 family metallopeptidase [Prolixibacteraceae bacterium]|jgi:hypothetical protein|nr:M56 family metallopeptidase [Prolixibacteraceae bacterium]
MTEVINYIFKSSVCLSILYLVFRWTMRKEALFTLNRYLLLATVIFSMALPFIQKPTFVNNSVNITAFPAEEPTLEPFIPDATIDVINISPNHQNVNEQRSISYKQTLFIVYIAGCIAMLALIVSGILRLLFLLTTTKVYCKKGFKLALVNRSISPMSFGRYIIMSKLDYKEHRAEILNHEKAHLKFNHSLDILFIELVKIIHWFNPIVYLLKKDIKEIQEFQVDRYIIDSGIDSKSYQLLMIKKCVGTERYALANSFNHCQIKNRITMMNNQKNQKSKSWKVAIFLPVAALMLLAFGNNRSEIPTVKTSSVKSEVTTQKKSEKNSRFNNANIEKRKPYELSIVIKEDYLTVNGKKVKQLEEIENQLRKSLKSYPPSITFFSRSRSKDSIYYSTFTEKFEKVTKEYGWKYEALYYPISNKTDNKFQDITVLNITEIEDYFMINGKKVKIENLETELRKLIVANKSYKIVRDFGTAYTNHNNKVLSKTIDDLTKERRLIRYEDKNKSRIASLQRKQINIEIENNNLKLNTYKVEIDEIIPRIKKLSKGFYGNLITVYHDGNSDKLKGKVRNLLECEKEKLNTDQKEEWIVIENSISNYPL